ncbi:MAG: competence protein ComE [Flavobacterium sp.]|nr:competence protein ComE [Flavobacterium sp.]
MFKFSKIKIYFLLLLLLTNGMIFYTVFAETRNNLLKVSFLDVGQGDAIFIESPSGNQFLIDGGPDKNILNALGRVMPFYDKTIDMVLVTHPDQDHIGGIPDVLKNYTVETYISSGATSSTGTFIELENEITKSNIKTEIARAGEIIDLGGGVYLKILYPNSTPKGKDTNEYSIVAKLYYGDSTFLFTGDAPTDVEDYLAKTLGKELKSEVLKVAHHGSRNSLSPEFLSAVSSQYSVISAGKDNRYGHPHKEIIDFLNSIKSKILGTYDLGDIYFVSDGQNSYQQ